MNPRRTKITDKRLSRRSFLKGAAAGVGAALALPTIVPSTVFGAQAPSNRITTGHIGVGNQGGGLLGSFAGQAGCQVLAICDPYQKCREDRAGAINSRYGNNSCKPYRDLREMLARDDIDAVIIATPDHWHVMATVLAAESGKDMYVEKPLGLSLNQDFACRKAVRRYGRIFQYGTQQRSSNHIRFGCELVRNGRIGKLTSVEVVSPGSVSGGSTAPAPVPDGFDYDLWLGPAPVTPYTRDRCVSSSHWYISDYALGFIAGWGAHPLDVMVWGLGDTADAVPVEYEGKGTFPAEGLFDTATQWDVRGKFANGVDFRFQGPGGDCTTFVGEKGKVSISRGSLRTEPESLVKEVIAPNEINLYRSGFHQGNFLDCVRSRKPTISPVDAAVLSDSVSHLSDMAIRTGRKIKYDPKNEKILNDSQAAALMTRAMRAPWQV